MAPVRGSRIVGSMNASEKGVAMRSNIFKWGGIAASVILIAFGAGSIAIGAWGINNVRDNLKLEQITGSPDMTPAAIKAEGQKAGLTGVTYPTESVAGETIDTGSQARVFASYMRIHALEATGGQTYSQMGRFLDAKGNPTSDESQAAKDPKTGQPVENGLRNLWVTETALTNALNTSFFAEQVALFGIVVGAALLLAGFGFGILAFMAFRWLPAREDKLAKAPTTAPVAV
jgi:hypothetical protein